MTLPYYLQRYPLDGHRRLVLTPRDLEWLTQWQDARLEGAFGPRRLTTVYEGERTSVPVSLHAGGGIASGRPLVPYLDRLVDGRDVFYQDDIAVPPPEEEEEDEELAQEAAATVNLVPVDPLLDESGFYRRLGVDGRDAVVIYIRR
jgi:hypothetical protein